MATSLTFKELISSTIKSGSEFYVNKNSSGDTAEAIVVFNKPSTVMNISAYYPTISSVKVGGNNIFTEIIYVDFTAGKYSYTSGWSAASFSTKQDEISEKDGTTSSSVSLTGSSNSVGDGWYPAYKILVKAKNATVGDKVVMSGFSLSVDYTVPQYTITWANIDGKGGSTTTTVNGGTVPTYSGTPTKATDNQYTYTFSGWSPSVVAATANATYTAQFTSTPRYYTVTAAAYNGYGGKVNQSGSGSYTYNSEVTLTAIPDEGYRFAYWYDASSNTNPTRTIKVTINTTYYAIFERLSYTATFLDGDGSPLHTVPVLHGDTPSCPLEPIKASTAEYIYTWNTSNPWTPAISAATGNQTYTPNFIAQKRTYSVSGSSFPEEAGTVTGSGDYEYGSTATLVATPNSGYEFLKWLDDGDTNPTRQITVTGYCSFTAHFGKITQVYSAKSLTQPYSGNKVVGVYVGNTKI